MVGFTTDSEAVEQACTRLKRRGGGLGGAAPPPPSPFSNTMRAWLVSQKNTHMLSSKLAQAGAWGRGAAAPPFANILLTR